jgi:hypothetical protein
VVAPSTVVNLTSLPAGARVGVARVCALDSGLVGRARPLTGPTGTLICMQSEEGGEKHGNLKFKAYLQMRALGWGSRAQVCSVTQSLMVKPPPLWFMGRGQLTKGYACILYNEGHEQSSEHLCAKYISVQYVCMHGQRRHHCQG